MGVAIESSVDILQVVIRDGVLEHLRATPWGNGHLLYDWRLTFGGTRWMAEARKNGTRTLSRLG